MRNKRLIFFVILTASMMLGAQQRFATVSYAEGNSLTVIRDGKALRYNPDRDDVLGLALMQEDLIQTGSGTFLEIQLQTISVRVQIAEHTSFRVTAERQEQQSAGELYYGRVRAKVAKLSGNESYRVNTPSLVAGVRGTDFSVDVIAVRPGTQTPSAEGGAATAGNATPVLYRVAVFEGTVAVQPAEQQVPEMTVVVTSNQMVERLTAGAPVLSVVRLDPQISEFWNVVDQRVNSADVEETPVSTPRAEPVASLESAAPPAMRNKKPGYAAGAALIGLGAVAGGLGLYNSQLDTVSSGTTTGMYITGGTLAGTGLLMILFNAIMN